MKPVAYVEGGHRGLTVRAGSHTDALAAVAIFLIVVAATFPVVLPFAFFSDVAVAKWTSRGLSLAMLFAGELQCPDLRSQKAGNLFQCGSGWPAGYQTIKTRVRLFSIWQL